MKLFLSKVANRVAPRTVANLRTLSALDKEFDEGSARFVNYERELRALRREIDELRRDNRRVTELYDAVFERAKRDAAAAGVVPSTSARSTVESAG
jgi:predicted  nucleic acid-binding Zn-ribbon protein